MSIEFTPAGSAGAWQIGTPPIFSAAPLYGALSIMREAGIERIHAKSMDLTTWLISLVDAWLAEPPYSFAIGSPREATRRGGHIALEHPDAVAICKALKACGIVTDVRPPNVLRIAPMPLSTTYDEIWQTVAALREIVASGEHQPVAGSTPGVAASR
jgi:kynureninase